MRFLFSLFLLLPLGAQAQMFTTNIAYAWDPSPASQQPVAYRFYEQLATNLSILLGVTTNTTFTVTNEVVGIEHIYFVTATNTSGNLPFALRESAASDPLRVPAAPTKPLNLKTVKLPPLTAPAGALVQVSTDLVNWSPLVLVTPNAGVFAASSLPFSTPPDQLFDVQLYQPNDVARSFLRVRPPPATPALP